jgi:hypothetical protein
MAAAFLIGLALLGLTPPIGPSPAATDALTLRDGKVVLGQILESDRRGPLLVLVRRDWAAKNLPDRLASWEKLEAPITQRAEAQRRSRLEAWKRDRPRNAVDGDRITPWIDGELARLANPDPKKKSPLMVVKIGRTEVKTIDRKPRKANRLLRLGWLSDFPDVETMPQSDLVQAVEGRGFSANSDAPVSVDSLLPIPLEDDVHWLIRRGATEIINDPGGRILRYQGMVMAEPAAGEAPPAGAALNAAIGGLKELLGEPQADPLPGKLHDLAGKGRVGAVVTRLDMAPDMSSTVVETTLWVRLGDRWNPAISRSSTVRPDDLPANAGQDIAEDPQVKAVFGVVESLGLGTVPPEMKRRSLNMGAATRQALGQARGALDQELNAMALSLEPAKDRPAAPKP